MGKRGALVAAAAATGLVVAGVCGGLALAQPAPPRAPVRIVVVPTYAPAYSDDAVTTTTAPVTTTTTTVSGQPQPAIGAPAGCRYTNTCAATTAPVSP